MKDRLAEIYRELKRLFDDHRVLALSGAYTAGVLVVLFLIAAACGGGSATARAEARRGATMSRQAPRPRARPAPAQRSRREEPASFGLGQREYEVDLRGQGVPPPDPGTDPSGPQEIIAVEDLPPGEDVESFETLPPAVEELRTPGTPPPGAE